jgi:hypothetical protein
LTLINGWTNAPFGTSNAAVVKVDGIVHFKGAIATSGTNTEPFVLPKGFQPAFIVYIPVDLCGATNGRLIIFPNGEVFVQAETSFSDAQCFTSLDGASFAVTKESTPLSLLNGWTNYGHGTRGAEVLTIGHIVHFQGAIATSGTNTLAFVLPPQSSPGRYVYIPVNLCGATKGRLVIYPSGEVHVQAEKSFSNAQCFTSLDGAWFGVESHDNPVFAEVDMICDCQEGPYGTSIPERADINGIIYFLGAFRSYSSYSWLANTPAFSLAPNWLPAKKAYVPVDLCNATNGRLFISNDSEDDFFVQPEGSWSNAQCFTSLDGVSYVQ